MTQAAVARAWELFQQKQADHVVLDALGPIGVADALHAQAQHVRGALAMRRADYPAAQALLVEAIRRGEGGSGVWLNLVRTSAKLGMADGEALDLLGSLVDKIAPERLFPFTVELLRALNFGDRRPAPYKAVAFEVLFIPILARLLALRQMDQAIELESLLYENYVKPTETEAHFGWCMSRIEPLFTAAGHRWRAELPPLAPVSLEPPYKIGFFIHNASMLAHIEVLLNTLKGYRRLTDQPFEPVVYCLGGKSPQMEAALAQLDVRLVMLDATETETERSIWQRLLRLRELIATDGVQQLVWISLVTLLPLAFAMGMACVQTWFAMKYRSFSQPDIDGYVSGSALTRFGTIAGRRWRTAMLGVDDWYDPSVESQARAIRERLGERPVLMSLARTEKMQELDYQQALCAILAENPEAVFLWAGREQDAKVTAAFEAAGVLDRTHFLGWVNTRLYAQVADIFLDTFPFPCGFTLFQAMAAGKPVVIYDSPEAAQTGLWNFIKPVIEDGEGSAAERAELLSFVGPQEAPLIPVARSPEDYVRQASRLARDAQARAESGKTCQAFMRRYFSDPSVMGGSLAAHFIELIEQKR